LLALRPFGSGRSALARPTADFDDRFAVTYLDPRSANSGPSLARNAPLEMTGQEVELTSLVGEKPIDAISPHCRR
jgi:hypothetical protein